MLLLPCWARRAWLLFWFCPGQSQWDGETGLKTEAEVFLTLISHVAEAAYSVQAFDWSGSGCRGKEGLSTRQIPSLPSGHALYQWFWLALLREKLQSMAELSFICTGILKLSFYWELQGVIYKWLSPAPPLHTKSSLTSSSSHDPPLPLMNNVP